MVKGSSYSPTYRKKDEIDIKLIQFIFQQKKEKVGALQIKMILENDYFVEMNHKKIRRNNLIYATMDPKEANLFFQLFNDQYNNSSIILTSNRSPKEWTELLGDVGVATAILDRLIHRAKIVHFIYSS